MTSGGGVYNHGSVFSYNLTSTAYVILHSFVYGQSDGSVPYGGLTLWGTTLYGMTYYGGANGKGTVFKLDTGGSALTLLHSFGSAANDGAYPYGSLTVSACLFWG